METHRSPIPNKEIGEDMFKTCAVMYCESTNLVYSGTDAFMLGGVPTETYCYQCATAYVMIYKQMDKLKEVKI